MRSFRDDHGQILMLAGVTITIGILSLAVVTVGLSGVSSSSQKKSFIKYEYDNVRQQFGIILKERIVDLNNYDDNTIIKYIEDTEDLFAYIENLNGYHFNVILDTTTINNIIYKSSTEKVGIKCGLYLSNGVDTIYEDSVEFLI